MNVHAILFSADWCGPCKALKPLWGKLEGEYSEVMSFEVVDVDKDSEQAAKFGVKALPTIVVTKDGEKVDQIVGLANEKKLKETFDKVLGE